MPNSDTILCVITCRFTRKIVQILEQCSGLKGKCKTSMLIFTLQPAEPTPRIVCSRNIASKT